MQAIVTLEYTDDKTAKAIAAAVSPDNFKTPVGLHVRTANEGSQVITAISYDGKLATFMATIDDLLFCASTAEKALATIEKI